MEESDGAGTREASNLPDGGVSADPMQVALEVIRHCVAGRVRQISRVITAKYDQELAELDVTANQATILSVITVLGQATPTDLAPYLQMDASTISRNVQRMIDRHWLAIIPGEDRRSHFLVVAPRGLDVLRRIRPGWERAQKWAAGILGDEGVSAVCRIASQVNPLLPG
jgi:DNA-binding MarR family transcriptional regulator